MMETVIEGLKGKRIEVNCGSGVAFAGENLGVEDGVLKIECDGKKLYVDVAKIVVINEAADAGGKPGFIG